MTLVSGFFGLSMCKQNLVKGYISHKAKFLVMASTIEKAFPKISLVA